MTDEETVLCASGCLDALYSAGRELARLASMDAERYYAQYCKLNRLYGELSADVTGLINECIARAAQAQGEGA